MISGGRILITSIPCPAICVRMRCFLKSAVTIICAKSSRSTRVQKLPAHARGEFARLVELDRDHHARARALP